MPRESAVARLLAAAKGNEAAVADELQKHKRKAAAKKAKGRPKKRRAAAAAAAADAHGRVWPVKVPRNTRLQRKALRLHSYGYGLGSHCRPVLRDSRRVTDRPGARHATTRGGTLGCPSRRAACARPVV